MKHHEHPQGLRVFDFHRSQLLCFFKLFSSWCSSYQQAKRNL